MSDNCPYRLDPVPLGRGGQAFVFRGVHRETETVRAVKRYFGNQAARDRARREIEVLSQIHHYNVMPVSDFADDYSWMAMPLAERNLQETVLFDERALWEPIFGVAQALAHIHEKGLLHRDVKPANVLLIREGGKARWVLSDWGLVRRPLNETTTALTKVDTMLGTEPFAAPEMWEDAHHAPLSVDVYSLGRVAAWAATGREPLPRIPLLPERTNPWRDFIEQATADVPRRLVDGAEAVDALARLYPQLAGGAPVQIGDGDLCGRCRSWVPLNYPRCHVCGSFLMD